MMPPDPMRIRFVSTPIRASITSGAVQANVSIAWCSDIQNRVFRSAVKNNVAIYTLDPRGLALSEFDMGENVSQADDMRIKRESEDLLHVIADATDGRAIVNRNDPVAALRQMVRDSSAYYLLSYTSSLAPRDGKFHEIQVRVKRRDLEVRAEVVDELPLSPAGKRRFVVSSIGSARAR